MFITGKRDTNYNQPKEETHRVGSQRVPSMKLPLSEGQGTVPVWVCGRTDRGLPGKLA